MTDLAEWRRRGGRASSNASRAAKRIPDGLLSLDELRGVIGLTIADVRSGTVDPPVGSAVASLARAYIAVAEAGTLEERLRDLEARADAALAGRWSG
jgi:hypothetical protein